MGPGFLDSYGGTFEGDTPIARVVGVQRLDPSADVHMPIAPALAVTLGPSAGSADGQQLVPTLAELYNYVAVSIIPALAPYL